MPRKALILLVVSIFLATCSVKPPDGLSRAKYAQAHHFSGFALPSSPTPCLLQDFYDLLHEKYGDQLLTWRVKKLDDTNWVFQFPSGLLKKQNLATMDSLKAFVEGYPDEAICIKREDFESLFPLIDNTGPQAAATQPPLTQQTLQVVRQTPEAALPAVVGSLSLDTCLLV